MMTRKDQKWLIILIIKAVLIQLYNLVNQKKRYPDTFKFTYSLQYDESCDCQRIVPSNFSAEDRDVETLEPPLIPFNLYINIVKEFDTVGLSKKDKSSTKLGNLRMYLIQRGRDERGALMVISGGFQPICDEEFNDRTAIALCQLHGFETGRRTSISLISRQLASWDPLELLLIENGIVHYDSRRFHCFSVSSITHHPGQAHNDLDKDFTNTTLGTQMLSATDNISIADTCSELTETHVPCSRNQAAAVFCHNNDPPFLQFYNIEIHVGLTKFYITFNARYVKLGRIYEYFEDFPISQMI